MNLFNTSAASLKKASENALAVFQKTIDSLTKVSNKAIEKKREKEEEIQKLQTEAEALQQVSDANNKMISKLTSIFKD